MLMKIQLNVSIKESPINSETTIFQLDNKIFIFIIKGDLLITASGQQRPHFGVQFFDFG